MSTALFWIVFAAVVITIFGIGWAKEWERRLNVERRLNASEMARLAWEAKARRLAYIASGRDQVALLQERLGGDS